MRTKLTESTDIALETHLYFCRHGETEFNKRGIVQGRGVDVPLNATGISQARALGKRLDRYDVSAVYASTLLRARQTASIVSDVIGVNSVYFLRDLEEMSWGIKEGLPPTPELKQSFIQLISEWQSGNFEYAIPGGESVLDVKSRALRVMAYLVEKHRGQHTIIIAHGRLLRILFASILKDYGLKKMEDIHQDNTCFNHLVYTNEVYDVMTINCTLHLNR